MHTYFNANDIRNCKIIGLKGLYYNDKVDNMIEKEQTEEELLLNDNTMLSMGNGYYIDRIYKNITAANTTTDYRSVYLYDNNNIETKEANNNTHNNRNGQYKIQIDISNSAYPDTVIFNPWMEGKKGDKGPDFDDNGYNYMICIEPAVATAPIILNPGDVWNGVTVMTISDNSTSV